MRIAVTGGTGFIGKHLAQRLILEGHEVVLVARGKNARSEVGSDETMKFVASDLSDLAPTRRFTDDQISKGLPAPGSFGLHDLRCCA